MFEKLTHAIEMSRIQRRQPEAVEPAVHSMDAYAVLLGRGDHTMVSRMKASPVGRRLLNERHDILALLADRDALRKLPDGSLGREYGRFAEDNGLFPEVLAKQVRTARAATGGHVPNATADVAYLHDRYRDLHDLWHVLTGYGTDMAGEWSLIAFQTRQVGYRSMAVMAFSNCAFHAVQGRPDLIVNWFSARRRAAKANYLLAEDWEKWLPRPLEEVRRALRIDPPKAYRTWNYPTGIAEAVESS